MTGSAVHTTATNLRLPSFLHIPRSPAIKPQATTHLYGQHSGIHTIKPRGEWLRELCSSHRVCVLTCGCFIAGGGQSQYEHGGQVTPRKTTIAD